MATSGSGRRPGRDPGRGAGLALPWPVRTSLLLRNDLLAAWLRRQAEIEMAERRLFLWLPAAFGLGIVLYFGADQEPWPWAWVPGLVASASLAWVLRRRAGAGYRIVLVVLFTFAGFGAACWRTARVAGPVLDRPRTVVLTARVESLEERASGARLLLRPVAAEGLAAGRLPLRVRVVTPNRPHVAAGDMVQARARLVPPPQPSRPGGYDFAREAYFGGIGAVGSVPGALSLVPAEPAPGWRDRMAAAVDRARNQLTRRIVDAIGGPAGAVAASLVTGKRGLIPDATNDDLRAAGIYHVVSISGLHMVLAAGMVFWIVRALLAIVPALVLRYPVKKWSACAAIAAAFAYNVFAGSEIATERSLVMTVVLLGAVLADRPAFSMRNLAWAALVVLAMEPESLAGPSFQMSFGAVAALIAVFERPGRPSPQPEVPGGWAPARAEGAAEAALPDGPVRRQIKGALRHVGLALLTTLVAEAATAPFSLYHFQRIAPYGLVGNALTLPLVSFVVMPAAVIGVMAMPFGWDEPVWIVMGWGVTAMLRVSGLVASWPDASRTFPAFGPGALALLSLGLLMATLCRSSLRWLAVPTTLAGVAAAALAVPADVVATADGTSLAVRGPDGRLVVVGRRPSSFALEQWLRADGDGRTAEDRSLFQAARCDAWGCVARLPDGRPVVQVVRRDAFEEDCGRAAILVTPLQAPPFCRPPILIDATVLARRGAIALVPEAATSPAGYRLVAARAAAAERPWMPVPWSAAVRTTGSPDRGRTAPQSAGPKVPASDRDPEADATDLTPGAAAEPLQ